jgi:hypothetical protein
VTPTTSTTSAPTTTKAPTRPLVPGATSTLP